jgi:inosine/xanthosine triphosphatase
VTESAPRPDAVPEDGVSFVPRRIAVGSANPGKIAAVRQAVARYWPQAAVAGINVPSGVPEQPRNDAEGARGAVLRAAAARRALDADVGIGLEGSSDEHPWGMYTVAWVAVVDRAGRVGLASTGRCPLPAPVAAGIQAGGELGPLVDDLLGEANTKHRGGASAAFTAGHAGRIDSLAGGVIYACAPFLTPAYFGPAAMGHVDDVLARLAGARPLRTAYTLVFLGRPDGRVLLLHRTNPPNAGRLNGLGGGIEAGEDVLEAAAREVREEVGLDVQPRLGLALTLWEAERQAQGAPPILLYVCRADVTVQAAAQVPAACPEGALSWVDPQALADLDVVPNLRLLLPLLLAREAGAGALVGTLWYDAGWQAGRYLIHTPNGPRRGAISP